MGDLVKDAYNYDALKEVAIDIKQVYQPFDVEGFLNATFDEAYAQLEYKDRVICISKMLGKYLPSNYKEAISIIDQVVMNYGDWLTGFVGFFPMFVEIYGQDSENWDISMEALARYTQYSSSEFAVRCFIIKDEKRMMKQMLEWARSDNEYTRRLACEGCRPALPWGQALVSFKQNPEPILPILYQLKNDSSIHVRKSVANNLNDISKSHPDLVIKIAKEWYGENKECDWIVKHACRTLLKSGNKEVLQIFGYGDVEDVVVKDLALAKKAIYIGEENAFTFVISAKSDTKVRLEYGVDYKKANGKHNRKIFKISEINLQENQTKKYEKKHSFADVSVRKHYAGKHLITLLVNGVEQGTLHFELQSK